MSQTHVDVFYRVLLKRHGVSTCTPDATYRNLPHSCKCIRKTFSKPIFRWYSPILVSQIPDFYLKMFVFLFHLHTLLLTSYICHQYSWLKFFGTRTSFYYAILNVVETQFLKKLLLLFSCLIVTKVNTSKINRISFIFNVISKSHRAISCLHQLHAYTPITIQNVKTH